MDLGSYSALVRIEIRVHKAGCLAAGVSHLLVLGGVLVHIRNSRSLRQYRIHPRNPSLYPTHSSTADCHRHRYNADAPSSVRLWCSGTSPPRWRWSPGSLAQMGSRGCAACTALPVARRGARRGRLLSCDLGNPKPGPPKGGWGGGGGGGGVRVS